MNDNSPIIGDLVEEYREVVLPERGRVRATLWFVRQLASLVPAWTWGGTLLGAACVGRNALDEFAPPADFHVRSTVTTFLLIGIVLGTTAWASWQSGSVAGGARTGVRAATMAAAFSIVGTGCLLLIWHDAASMAAVRASGGLGEAFELPVLMIIPAGVLGAVGGCVGAAFKRLRAA